MKPGASHQLQQIHNAFGHSLLNFLKLQPLQISCSSYHPKDTAQYLHPGYKALCNFRPDGSPRGWS